MNIFLKIWQDFIQRKTFSYFVLLLIIIFGIVSVGLLPKESSPEVQVPIAIIQTPYFGATALEVESQVTNEIEDKINNISGIKEIKSISSENMSVVTVQFNQNEDIDEKINEVKDEIDKIKVNFPDDVSETTVSDMKFSDQPIFSFAISSKETIFGLKKMADDLKEEMEDIVGVSLVSYYGIPEKEISILLNPERLERYNLSLKQVFNIIKQSGSKIPVGNIEINHQEYTLSLDTELKNTEDIENIPINLQSGDIIYVKDIALVVVNFKKQEISSKIYFSPESEINRSIMFYISKESGFNIMKLTDSVKTRLEELSVKDNILNGLDYKITMNLGDDAEKDIINLSKNGVMAVFLVFLILLFVLGVKDAFVAAIGIPISFLLSFIFFYLVGNTINFISLFSMILAIGILVDSDIVITEGIAKKKEEGLSEDEASESAIRKLAGPMIAGTATTIAVFVPLFFLSGVTGDFISSIPFTIVFILIASQFVSVFIVPLLHSFKFKLFKKLEAKFFKIHLPKINFKKMEYKYTKILLYFFQKKYRQNIFIFIIILLFFVTLIFPISGLLKSTFFPGGDVPLIYADIELPKGSSVNDTNKTLNVFNEIVKNESFYDSVVLTVGKTSDFNEKGAKRGDRFGNFLINLKDSEKATGVDILESLRLKVKEKGLEKIVTVSAPDGGPPSGAPIDFKILSNNKIDLEKASILAERILKNIEGTINVKSSLEKNNTGLNIKVNKSKLTLYNLSLDDVTSVLAASVKGIDVLELKNIDESLDVSLKYDLKNNGQVVGLGELSVDDLKSIKVQNNMGEYIYLSSVAEILPKNIDSNINHLNKIRSISISAEVTKDVNLAEIISQFKKEFEKKNNTKAKIEFGGEFAEQEKSFLETGMAFLGGIALMLGILIFLFNSIRLPLIIESVIPLAFSGVIIGLYITGNVLSFPAILGFIALSGIIVNNSILLIYSFERSRKNLNSCDVQDNIITLVVSGSISRFRPIILTTITTIVGVTPLIFTSAVWAPIAYSIIFGLLFATVITLIFIPILYRKFYPKK